MGIDSDRLLPQEQSLWSYVWRSALLPGWGQYYKKDTTAAFGFLAATAGLFVGDYILYRHAVAPRQAYEGNTLFPTAALYAGTTGPTFDFAGMIALQSALVVPTREDFERKRARLTLATGALAALWIVNLVNAVVADSPGSAAAPASMRILFAVSPDLQPARGMARATRGAATTLGVEVRF